MIALSANYTVQVVITQVKEEGYFVATAIVRWLGKDGASFESRTTEPCSSRVRAKAVAYALTEAAVAFERGEVP